MRYYKAQISSFSKKYTNTEKNIKTIKTIKTEKTWFKPKIRVFSVYYEKTWFFANPGLIA